MTKAEFNMREYTLRHSYRRAGLGWKGLVYWNPSWFDMNVDGIPSRLAWSGYALTERGLRRRLTRALRAERRKHEEGRWIIRGRRRAAA